MREMHRKYVFTGTLELTSGMHIGGGETNLRGTDSPVILTPEGDPFIPGSSFKGVFRSTIEKLVAVIPSQNTCSLILGYDCPTTEQEDFNDRRRASNWSETQLACVLKKELCDTCQLFGSPFSASKIFFSDLYVEEWVEAIQRRDGVAIDRDSEKAVEGFKYDYEVISVGSTFKMQIVLENPNDTDLGLVCVGLNEFVSGMGGIGGMRSRGLGNCKITEMIGYELDLTTPQTLTDPQTDTNPLHRYLVGKTLEEKMAKVDDMDRFIKEHIDVLLTRVSGEENAQTTS